MTMGLGRLGAGFGRLGTFQSGAGTLRQVATRSAPPTSFSAGNKQIMSRTVHRAMVDLTSLRAVFANWYTTTTSGEVLPGNVASLKASIEYPIGATPVRLYFSGADSVSIADGGTATTDLLAVSIPAGEYFAVKTFYENAAGIIFSLSRDGSKEAYTAAVSGLTDNTLTTVNPGTASGVAYAPAAIVGRSNSPSLFIIGDSRAKGAGEGAAAAGANGAKGEIERSIADSFAFINCATPSETAAAAASNNSRRLALAQYCTHVISNYGINDVFGGASAATIVTRLQALAALYPGKPFFQTTVSPVSTSTDSWATEVNQTTHANNSLRTALNDLLRAGVAGIADVFETADVVENSRNGGKWKDGYTSDGIHANPTGYAAIESSGVITPASFT